MEDAHFVAHSGANPVNGRVATKLRAITTSKGVRERHRVEEIARSVLMIWACSFASATPTPAMIHVVMKIKLGLEMTRWMTWMPNAWNSAANNQTSIQ